MLMRTLSMLLLSAAIAALTACSGSKPNPTAPNYIADPTNGQPSMFGDEGITFGGKKNRGSDSGGGGAGGALGVNAYLWRGALDTLSFMPLASADPFGGVIITDWYTPSASAGERFKATAYILGRELRSDGVRVSVFRQVLQNGQWVDAPVSAITVGEIENKVLSRARELREQSLASN
jgi:hypothetical protein